ncbi:MAG: hypothetical protein EBR86_10785 [Planctomycetia bacterium]|nr:hypothetical protein [Planctomycetia bacterium]
MESANEAFSHGPLGDALIDRAEVFASGSRRLVGPESWSVLKRQVPIEVLLFKIRLFELLG